MTSLVIEKERSILKLYRKYCAIRSNKRKEIKETQNLLISILGDFDRKHIQLG